jgi:hypothetical protein
MSIENNLKGVTSIFDSSVYNEVQDNIVEWLDWELLKKGNFFNSSLGELSPNNTDYSLLQISNNSNYSAGQAWDGFRPNWVWQSGVTVPLGFESPLVGTNDAIPGISGVYVDDTFYPSDTTGTYAHHVDYFNYKYINIIYANSLPWIREVSYKSMINGQDPILPPEMTVKMPFIGVETSSRSSTPLSLGGKQIFKTKVIFHCVAEDEYTRNQLLDIVSHQNDSKFEMFDSNSIIGSGDNPIDYRGSPVSGAMTYPELLNNHPLCTAYIRDTTVENATTVNSNVFLGTVSCNVETFTEN